MGRGRLKKKFKENLLAAAHEEGDPDSRLIALHPSEPIIAVASGPSLRIKNYKSGFEKNLPPVFDKEAPVNKNAKKKSEEGSVEDDSRPSIRVLAFSPDGRFLLTGGDNKLATVWDCSSWTCVTSWKTVKKISAGAISQDSRFVFFADKFGEVLVGDAAASLPAAAAASADAPAASDDPSVEPIGVVPETPHVFLGHFCAIVSSLCVSPDNRFLVSTDKDFKTRVNVIPPVSDGDSSSSPLNGSYEVQSYCLGHTSFVTSAAFVTAAAAEVRVPALVTCGGDGTVRLWDHVSGALLDTVVVADAEEASDSESEEGEGEDGEEDEGEEEGGGEGEGEELLETKNGDGLVTRQSHAAEQCRCRPAVFVAAHPTRPLVAVAVEGRDEIQILKLEATEKVEDAVAPVSLRFAAEERQTVAVSGVTSPCQLVFDCGDGADRIWVLGGAQVKKFESLHLGVLEWDSALGKYAAGSPSSSSSSAAVLPAEAAAFLERRELEEGERSRFQTRLEELRARHVRAGVKKGAAPATASNNSGVLQKRQYSEAERSERKKGRRDVRDKEVRVAAAAAAGDEEEEKEEMA